MDQYGQRAARAPIAPPLSWDAATQRYGMIRPHRAGRIIVYRAYDLGVVMGPFHRAIMEVTPESTPDEVFSRITMHWP